MPHSYTRQRQGRDFHSRLKLGGLANYLRNAEMSTEGNYNNINGIIGDNDPKDDTEKKTSLLEKLEYYKEEAERTEFALRNAVPTDGEEPPLERER